MEQAPKYRRIISCSMVSLKSTLSQESDNMQMRQFAFALYLKSTPPVRGDTGIEKDYRLARVALKSTPP